MASSTTTLTLILIFTIFSISTSDDKLTAYEALQTFNFPVGLLPKGAKGYALEEESGTFKAFFGGSCSFALEGSYELRYKPTISGIISKNRLTSLTGVSVKIYFLWLSIVEVRRVGDDLEFSVGIASANFPVDNFNECPQCGCGMDCSKVGDSVSSI